MLFAVCCVPVTGEQYVRQFNDRSAFEAFLMEELDSVSYVIEGVEVDLNDFIKPNSIAQA